MKFILQIILIAILSTAVEFILPWWSVAVVAFIVTLVMGGKGGRGFLASFLGVGLCWLVAAMCHDVANEHILSARMAVLFKLPTYGLFMVVTVFIGGLIGGLAGWAGALLKPVKGR